MQRQVITLFFILLFFSGCGKQIIVLEQNPYQNRFKNIIGTKNVDARTVVDQGEVLKVWIAPYVTADGTLMAGQDAYIWIHKPRFISGTSIPTNGGTRSAIPTEYRDLPFTLHDGEIDDRGNIQDDKVIDDYVNKGYKTDKTTIMQEVREGIKKLNREKQQ